jgi:adenylate cyclase class 2
VRDEMEVTVDEGETLAAILTKLGLAPTFRYQKYRTTYENGDLLVTVDETPIGTFLELEGPKPGIDAMAGKLGYSASDYILGSYRDLFVGHQGREENDPGNMLFNT